jgi:hypothetical protein
LTEAMRVFNEGDFQSAALMNRRLSAKPAPWPVADVVNGILRPEGAAAVARAMRQELYAAATVPGSGEISILDLGHVLRRWGLLCSDSVAGKGRPVPAPANDPATARLQRLHRYLPVMTLDLVGMFIEFTPPASAAGPDTAAARVRLGVDDVVPAVGHVERTVTGEWRLPRRSRAPTAAGGAADYIVLCASPAQSTAFTSGDAAPSSDELTPLLRTWVRVFDYILCCVDFAASPPLFVMDPMAPLSDAQRDAASVVAAYETVDIELFLTTLLRPAAPPATPQHGLEVFWSSQPFRIIAHALARFPSVPAGGDAAADGKASKSSKKDSASAKTGTAAPTAVVRPFLAAAGSGVDGRFGYPSTRDAATSGAAARRLVAFAGRVDFMLLGAVLGEAALKALKPEQLRVFISVIGDDTGVAPPVCLGNFVLDTRKGARTAVDNGGRFVSSSGVKIAQSAAAGAVKPIVRTDNASLAEEVAAAAAERAKPPTEAARIGAMRASAGFVVFARPQDLLYVEVVAADGATGADDTAAARQPGNCLAYSSLSIEHLLQEVHDLAAAGNHQEDEHKDESKPAHADDVSVVAGSASSQQIKGVAPTDLSALGLVSSDVASLESVVTLPRVADVALWLTGGSCFQRRVTPKDAPRTGFACCAKTGPDARVAVSLRPLQRASLTKLLQDEHGGSCCVAFNGAVSYTLNRLQLAPAAASRPPMPPPATGVLPLPILTNMLLSRAAEMDAAIDRGSAAPPDIALSTWISSEKLLPLGGGVLPNTLQMKAAASLDAATDAGVAAVGPENWVRGLRHSMSTMTRPPPLLSKRVVVPEPF